MHYEDKKKGFKFSAVSGLPKENTAEAFEELFADNKAKVEPLPFTTLRTNANPDDIERLESMKVEVLPVEFATPPASTVLTDERIEQLSNIAASQGAQAGSKKFYEIFTRLIQREVIGQNRAPSKQPTEAMLNAARDWSVKKYGNGIGNDAAIGCWQAMNAADEREPREVAAQAGQVAVPDRDMKIAVAVAEDVFRKYGYVLDNARLAEIINEVSPAKESK